MSADYRGELDDLELGERVGWLLSLYMFGMLYSRPRDRVFAAVGYIVRAVGQAARDRGLPYPDEWRCDTEAWDTSDTYPL